MRNRLYFVWLHMPILALLLLSYRVMAQGITTGSITGTVVDPQSAVISDASITVTESNTGVVRTTTSQKNGAFAFRDAPIGTYSVHIEAAGFQALDVKGIPVVSGGTANLKDEQMTIGTNTTVEVQGSIGAQIDTTQSQLSTTFSTAAIESLPLGNGFDEVTFLIPGVSRGMDATFSNTNASTGTSVNGQRARSNNFEIDGQSNNDNSIGGPQVLFGNQDALQEIQVITNNFSAQYGRNMGSVVNYITKNGTNTFHGTAFELYTGSWLSSYSNQEKTALDGFCAPGQNPVVDDCTVPTLPRLTNNNFGATFGGPILKNKLWFFGSAYWQRAYTGVIPAGSAGLVTPTPTGLTQLQSDFPNSSAVAILSAYGPFGVPVGNPVVIPGTTTNENVTLPNGAVTQVQVGQFQRSVATPFLDNEQLGRLDWQPTQNDHLFGRYYHSNTTLAAAGGLVSTGYFANLNALSDSIGADWTHTFSPRLVDQIRYSYQESKVFFEGGSDPNCTSSNFSECAADLIFIGGTNDASFGLNGAFPEGRTVKVTQVQDNATWTKGSNTILMGGEFDYQNSPNIFLPNFNGAFLYNNLSDFLNDPIGTGQLDLTNGNPVIPFTENDFALYVQDDWKVSSNFTASLGLRYEFFGQAVNELNKISVAQQTGSAPFWSTALPLSATTFPKSNSQWKNIEPRVGFNWNPSAFKSKLVVRGGYALNYDPAFYNPFLNAYDAAPVTNNAVFGCNGPCLPANGQFSGAAVRAANLKFLPTGGDPRTQNQSIFPVNFRNPRAQTYYLGVQYQVSNFAVLSAQYVGVHGSQNFQSIDENPNLLTVAQSFPNFIAPSSLCQDQTAPGYGRPNCANGNVSEITNGAWLIYNGLQTNLTTQNLHGLTATLSYTYSRAIDNASEIFSTAAGGGVSNQYPQNPLDPNQGERGVSATSYPNVTSLALTYQLPFHMHRSNLMEKLVGGYSLNTIWIYNSGVPYNPLQPLTLPSGDTSYCDGVFNTSFPGSDTCRMIVSNPRAPLNTVAYLTTDPANPTAPASYYVYGSTGQTASNGALIPGTPISQSDAHWIVNNQLEANVLGNPFPGSGRNILRGQPYDNVDASIFKTTKLSESVSLQLQLNAYNVFNHDFLGTPLIGLTNFNSSLAVNPFLSNKYNATGLPNIQNVTGNRLIQIGGKIIF